MSDDKFQIIAANLSPERPIRSSEFLRGRLDDLENIQRELRYFQAVPFIYGYRGVGKTSLARTAAQMIKPDIGFALDVDISGDSPGSEGLVQKMGKGVAISAGDGSMIPNPKLRKFVMNIAEENEIRHQPAFLKFGGTDAGQIHLAGMGAPSLFLGIPTRYIHSHNGMLDLEDVESAVQLLVEVLKKLDEKAVESFTAL